MNYIKEINAFHDRAEQNPVSASAALLWYILMHVNNKTMWSKTFVASWPLLRLRSGLTESSFKRARKELKEKGYINYQSRPNNQAPVYRMIPLSEVKGNNVDDVVWEEHSERRQCVGMDTQGPNRQFGELDNLTVNWHVTSNENQITDSGQMDLVEQQKMESNRLMDDDPAPFVNQDMDPLMDRGMNRLTDRDAGTLIKQKQNRDQTIQSQTTTAAEDAFVFYQNNFGEISPYVTDALLNWVRDVGEPLVLEAMRRAIERNKMSWSYVKGILQNWTRKGIMSIEDALAEETAFRNQRQTRSQHVANSWASGHQAEVVPDWFDTYKQKRNKATWKKREAVETEEDIAEFEALLAEFRGK
ncbi:DnaD domain protein [Lentibacillus sp. N15]|uniref:DnaD domain-containing protein n=1 Tax=Lentibacillus songyuanensis TaxID=3136161 RepID=UPI0031BA3BA0